MKKSIITITTLTVICLAAASAYAWGPGRGMNKGYRGDCPNYSGKNYGMNLTQEQQDQFNALQQKFIDETYELRSKKFTAHHEMKLLMETSTPDRGKLLALSDEIADISKQLRDKRIDFALEAKKIAPELNLGMGMGRGKGYGHRGKGGNFGGNGPRFNQAPCQVQ